jgi:hypothetical protein
VIVGLIPAVVLSVWFYQLGGGWRAVIPVIAIALLFAVWAGRPRAGAPRPGAGSRTSGRPSGVSSYAATLCPHGVQLRRPGTEPVLLDWSQIREVEIYPHRSGAVVAARLAPGADPIGMPAAHRLVNELPADPDLRWLGRLGTADAEAIRSSVSGWRAAPPLPIAD